MECKVAVCCIAFNIMFRCVIYLICYTEPGVPYTVTVRVIAAAGKGKPASIVVFAVQQGNVVQMAVCAMIMMN